MVASEKIKGVWKTQLVGQEETNCLYGLLSSVYIVTHKEVLHLAVRVAGHVE